LFIDSLKLDSPKMAREGTTLDTPA
jgi:hypothetical protein